MTKPFSSPLRVKNSLPLSLQEHEFIARSRQRAIDILERNDQRLVCIVGPCSIHDYESAIEYAKRFKILSDRVAHSFFLIMRVYIEKSRTRDNWKGFLYDPDLDETCDIEKGLHLSRQLLLELAELEVPCASEFLDPLTAKYYSDLITWGFIGARTSSSSTHRQLASHFDFPIGFKNNLFGEIDASIQGIEVAKKPQHFLGMDDFGMIAIEKNNGNPFCHLVLRGSASTPNYDLASIEKATAELKKHQLSPRVLIDCSHGNSQKDYLLQPQALQSTIRHIMEGNDDIMGLMLESHLEAGKQPHLQDAQDLRYGLSITDSCIGWDETEALLLDAASLLSPTSMSFVQK